MWEISAMAVFPLLLMRWLSLPKSRSQSGKAVEDVVLLFEAFQLC